MTVHFNDASLGLDATGTIEAYAHVADKDAAALVRRTHAPERHGTVVISRLGDLVDLLSELVVAADSVVDV